MNCPYADTKHSFPTEQKSWGLAYIRAAFLRNRNGDWTHGGGHAEGVRAPAACPERRPEGHWLATLRAVVLPGAFPAPPELRLAWGHCRACVCPRWQACHLLCRWGLSHGSGRAPVWLTRADGSAAAFLPHRLQAAALNPAKMVQNALGVYLSHHVASKTVRSQKDKDENFNLITEPKKKPNKTVLPLFSVLSQGWSNNLNFTCDSVSILNLLFMIGLVVGRLW